MMVLLGRVEMRQKEENKMSADKSVLGLNGELFVPVEGGVEPSLEAVVDLDWGDQLRIRAETLVDPDRFLVNRELRGVVTLDYVTKDDGRVAWSVSTADGITDVPIIFDSTNGPKYMFDLVEALSDENRLVSADLVREIRANFGDALYAFLNTRAYDDLPEAELATFQTGVAYDDSPKAGTLGLQTRVATPLPSEKVELGVTPGMTDPLYVRLSTFQYEQKGLLGTTTVDCEVLVRDAYIDDDGQLVGDLVVRETEAVKDGRFGDFSVDRTVREWDLGDRVKNVSLANASGVTTNYQGALYAAMDEKGLVSSDNLPGIDHVTLQVQYGLETIFRVQRQGLMDSVYDVDALVASADDVSVADDSVEYEAVAPCHVRCGEIYAGFPDGTVISGDENSFTHAKFPDGSTQVTFPKSGDYLLTGADGSIRARASSDDIFRARTRLPRVSSCAVDSASAQYDGAIAERLIECETAVMDMFGEQ